MAAPISRSLSMWVGTALAVGVVMWVHAGPTVTSDTERSQFEQTTRCHDATFTAREDTRSGLGTLRHRVASLPALDGGDSRQHQSGNTFPYRSIGHPCPR